MLRRTAVPARRSSVASRLSGLRVRVDMCREGSQSFDAEGCTAVAEVTASEMMGKAVLGLEHSLDPPLPSAQLDELRALCQ